MSITGWEEFQPSYRKPTIKNEPYGLFMARANGTGRYLTKLESMMYVLFHLWPKDHWTHKDSKGYTPRDDEDNDKCAGHIC